jgi:hypothetical protein
MKISALILMVGCYLLTFNSWSLATLGVPNIQINDWDNLPGFLSKDTHDSDQATKQLIQKQIGAFSIQIRRQIRSSQTFQIIDIDPDQALAYLTLESANSNLNIVTSTPIIKPKNLKDGQLSKGRSRMLESQTPNFMLLGQLSALSAGEGINRINDTNKFSAIYNIDIAVDYKLVRTKDHAIVAIFTAAGHSGDAKIIAAASKPNHKIPLLIQQAGADLADEVISELQLQLGNGKLNPPNQESPPHTL